MSPGELVRLYGDLFVRDGVRNDSYARGLPLHGHGQRHLSSKWCRALRNRSRWSSGPFCFEKCTSDLLSQIKTFRIVAQIKDIDVSLGLAVERLQEGFSLQLMWTELLAQLL